MPFISWVSFILLAASLAVLYFSGSLVCNSFGLDDLPPQSNFNKNRSSVCAIIGCALPFVSVFFAHFSSSQWLLSCGVFVLLSSFFVSKSCLSYDSFLYFSFEDGAVCLAYFLALLSFALIRSDQLSPFFLFPAFFLFVMLIYALYKKILFLRTLCAQLYNRISVLEGKMSRQ